MDNDIPPITLFVFGQMLCVSPVHIGNDPEPRYGRLTTPDGLPVYGIYQRGETGTVPLVLTLEAKPVRDGRGRLTGEWRVPRTRTYHNGPRRSATATLVGITTRD